VSVWADHPFMLDDDDEPLAVDGKLGDDLALVLAGEPLGLSCDLLALRLHRRRADVLAVLEADARFEHRGQRRGSRWVLAARRPLPASSDGLGRIDTPGSVSELTPAVSDAQNARPSA
jgi:hypothetical protein